MTAATGDPREEPPQDRPVVRDKRRIDPVTGALREPVAPPAPAAPADAVPTAATPAAANLADAGGVPVAPAANGADGGRAGGADAVDLSEQLAERTRDLQRLQAEYVNYRRRVDRDRSVVQETAVANVLGSLLPVLDDIGRAREHGELEGGFKAVAESLVGVVEKLGLVQFGEVGEPFDPAVHEALMHAPDPGVTEPTCVQVLQPGYRLGERVLRPARVAVAGTDG